MSLFGNNTNQAGGGSLFGNNANQNAGGGSLFGSTTNQPANTGSLFGNQPNKPAGGGLFGSSTAQNNAPAGGSLFGSNANQPAAGGSLFGGGAAQNQGNAGGSLFGGGAAANPQPNAGGGGLFGGAANQPAGGGGLFGTKPAAAQPAAPAPGLFGGAAAQNQGGSSLFGGNQNAANQPQQGGLGSAFGGGTSLFGTPAPQPQSSLFGGNQAAQNQNQQNPQAPQQLNASAFNPQQMSVGNAGHTMTYAQLQKLQFSGMSTVPNEKNISQQMITVANKWNPDNVPVTTTLKTYLYNAVPREYAPFFYPNTAAGEDENSWEEALSQKPEPPKIDGKEVTAQAYVPILCVGFKALGERLRTQANIVEEMRGRLHEMNNSLSAVMAAHQQRITVRIATAKRQHEVLSQRCLRLAVKVQVLRNRGYALSPAEESLRKTLMALEKQVTDPIYIGREDEIWARMVSLKERARWLEEEGKRVAAQSEQLGANAKATSGVPEEVLVKTRKILKDYDGQLQHLSKELEEVKKEYAEWEESQKPRR